MPPRLPPLDRFVLVDRRSLGPVAGQFVVRATWNGTPPVAPGDDDGSATPPPARAPARTTTRYDLVLPRGDKGDVNLFTRRREEAAPTMPRRAVEALAALRTLGTANGIDTLMVGTRWIDRAGTYRWKGPGETGFHEAPHDRLPQGVRDVARAADRVQWTLVPRLLVGGTGKPEVAPR